MDSKLLDYSRFVQFYDLNSVPIDRTGFIKPALMASTPSMRRLFTNEIGVNFDQRVASFFNLDEKKWATKLLGCIKSSMMGCTVRLSYGDNEVRAFKERSGMRIELLFPLCLMGLEEQAGLKEPLKHINQCFDLFVNPSNGNPYFGDLGEISGLDLILVFNEGEVFAKLDGASQASVSLMSTICA